MITKEMSNLFISVLYVEETLKRTLKMNLTFLGTPSKCLLAEKFSCFVISLNSFCLTIKTI